MPQSFIIKLCSETQVSGRLGMSGGISPRHAQNPLSGERRKTLSITHHALLPPPSHHHLYIIHLINWLQRFYRIIMSLKRPFVPKSDVKQWFTTTTTLPHHIISTNSPYVNTPPTQNPLYLNSPPTQNSPYLAISHLQNPPYLNTSPTQNSPYLTTSRSQNHHYLNTPSKQNPPYLTKLPPQNPPNLNTPPPQNPP